MSNISKIIREEINRYILSEAIDFTNLQSYANNLNNSLGIIRNVSNDQTIDDNLKRYLYNFVVYCVQIIAAINRCVNANTLNEVYWGGLSNYGINLPGELGGNIVSDFKQGYRGTKNFFMRNGKGTSGSNGYANGKRVDASTVPSIKLSVLLSQLPQKRNEYNSYDSRYNLSSNQSLATEFNTILGNNGIIENIAIEYNRQLGSQQQTQNAQGINP